MNESSPFTHLSTFGIDIIHSRSEASEMPPSMSAREAMMQAKFNGDLQEFETIENAASEVGKVVQVSRSNSDDDETLIDIFTADQVKAMGDRIHEYLGMTIDEHLAQPKQPRGYPAYVGRLALHFWSSEDLVTSNFGSFERQHTDPSVKATGPLERNSRQYAVLASETILKQFDSFYQAELEVKLLGPTKEVEGSQVSERGIAECQFLVLDYIRDELARGSRSNPNKQSPSMTIDDMSINITNLMVQRDRLVGEISALNPLLAEQVDHAIRAISEFTVEVIHRGRFGAPRFRREPDNARRAIERVEMLLVHAAAMSEARSDQEDIPILDI